MSIYNKKCEIKTPYKLDENWSYIDENGTEIKIDLPLKIKTQNGEVVIRNELAENCDNIQYIFIYTNEQRIKVYIDNKVIYSYDGENTEKIFKKVRGKRWNEVEIPSNSKGKTISIKIYSDFNREYECISDIYIRTKQSIIFYLLKTKLSPIIGTILIFVLGVILLFVGIVFKRLLYENRLSKYIGWYSILSSIWIITEIRITSFIIVDPIFISVLGSTAFMISPIPIVQYVVNIESYRYKKLASCIIFSFYINLVMNILLQLLNVTNFYNINYISHILISLSGLIIFLTLILDILKNKNKGVYIDTIAFGFLSISGFLEAFALNVMDVNLRGKIIRLGIILFIIILSIKLIKIIELSRRTKYYKEVARKDFMTGFENRNAYIRDLKEVVNKKNMSVLVFDINNLKLINDNHGHKLGDEAILGLCKILRESFYINSMWYRIGGDEFICLLEKWSKEDIEKCINGFYKKCREMNGKTIYRFEVAVGYASYDEGKDGSIYDTIERADLEMYHKKSSIKERNKY